MMVVFFSVWKFFKKRERDCLFYALKVGKGGLLDNSLPPHRCTFHVRMCDGRSSTDMKSAHGSFEREVSP